MTNRPVFISALVRVSEKMRRQYGVASRQQLLAWGLTEGQVEGLVTRGELTRVQRGVYALPGAVFCRQQQAMAAALRVRPAGRITGPFVLGLLRAEGFSLEDPFWVIHQGSGVARNIDFTLQVDPLPGRFYAQVEHLPSVNASRSIVESAAVIREKKLRVAIDSMKWANLTTNGHLRSTAEAFGDHPGAEAVLALLDDGTLDVESEGERTMQVVFEGIEPQPEAQVWLTPTRRVDRFWRDAGMAIEYGGKRNHEGRENRADDAERDEELLRRGYHVEYVYKEDLDAVPAVRGRLVLVRSTLLAARRMTSLHAAAPNRILR